MKKIITLLFVLTLSLSASALELTMNQVLKKAVDAMPVKEGITGNFSAKAMGMGESIKFATNGAMTFIDNKEEQEWVNDNVDYCVNTKEKSLTISKDEGSGIMILTPWVTAAGILKAEAAKGKITDIQMKKSKTEYEIDFKLDGNKAELHIDAKTFMIQCMKLKKGLITVTFAYSNIKKLTDPSILKFNKSKFVGYKLIDERNKAKTK